MSIATYLKGRTLDRRGFSTCLARLAICNHAKLLIEKPSTSSSDAGTLKEQRADAEQRLSESEYGCGAYARAEKDRDRAEAFLAIAQA
jgi:hypothetical protein